MNHGLRIRVIDGATVRALLPYDACIALMRDAMIEVSRGGAHMPLRQTMSLPTGTGRLGMMPGYLARPECFGIKLVSLIPGNAARGLSTHLGAYLLYDATTGAPQALMDAAVLTAIRTAAATAAATLALMAGSSRTLAIIGTGEQARAHLQAMRTAHPFARVVVWGRDPGRVRGFIEAADTRDIEAARSAEDAVRSADVICTVTSSPTPVLLGKWLRPGQHLNLVGASFAEAREIDDDGVERGRFIVDYRASAMAQAGEPRAASPPRTSPRRSARCSTAGRRAAATARTSPSTSPWGWRRRTSPRRGMSSKRQACADSGSSPVYSDAPCPRA